MQGAAEHHYQLVLIWMKDPATFDEYLRRLPPVVARYGGTGDRSFQPATIRAEGMALPDVVNLVHYDDKQSFERFNDDPDFKRIEHLRSQSVDLLSFGGRLLRSNPSSERLAERRYDIELVRYKDGSPDAYRAYEEQGEAAMRRYGFEVEYVLSVEAPPAGTQWFDLAKVSYFPTASAKAAFERDPLHRHIEEDLYPAAVDSVIRITASTRR